MGVRDLFQKFSDFFGGTKGMVMQKKNLAENYGKSGRRAGNSIDLETDYRIMTE